jgi:hypothetical protein
MLEATAIFTGITQCGPTVTRSLKEGISAHAVGLEKYSWAGDRAVNIGPSKVRDGVWLLLARDMIAVADADTIKRIAGALANFSHRVGSRGDNITDNCWADKPSITGN